jgi:hypothetical protein
MTDRDHGITDADVIEEWAEHAVKVDVWPDYDGGAWHWGLVLLTPDGNGDCDSETVDGGICDSRPAATASGAAAKEEYLRGLTRKA